MLISYWPKARALNSDLPYHALLDSLSDAGYTLKKEYMAADAAIIWSVLWYGRMSDNQAVWDHYRNQQKPVIVADIGGIKRGTTWKVGLNGINRSGYFGSVPENTTRWKSLGLELKNQDCCGEYILIAGQHDRSLQWQNQLPMSQWFLQIYHKIRQHTNKPILFRPHPRCRLPNIEKDLVGVYRQQPQKDANSYDNFDINFNNIYATVNLNSNPGIHSVINGIPAFVSSDSLAYDVANDINCLEKIENPVLPNRQSWLNYYAWTEYTVDEIASGLPVWRLKHRLGYGKDSSSMS